MGDSIISQVAEEVAELGKTVAKSASEDVVKGIRQSAGEQLEGTQLSPEEQQAKREEKEKKRQAELVMVKRRLEMMKTQKRSQELEKKEQNLPAEVPPQGLEKRPNLEPMAVQRKQTEVERGQQKE
ncbi:MAG TPA: hypothetical protein VJ179_03485 [Patescibacteria group bacterium]|nr:hypothetical protein [Patescibacteria group bacterium]